MTPASPRTAAGRALLALRIAFAAVALGVVLSALVVGTWQVSWWIVKVLP